jgi:hypothetical protein
VSTSKGIILRPALSNLSGKRQPLPRNSGQNGAMREGEPEARLLVVDTAATPHGGAIPSAGPVV